MHPASAQLPCSRGSLCLALLAFARALGQLSSQPLLPWASQLVLRGAYHYSPLSIPSVQQPRRRPYHYRAGASTAPYSAKKSNFQQTRGQAPQCSTSSPRSCRASSPECGRLCAPPFARELTASATTGRSRPSSSHSLRATRRSRPQIPLNSHHGSCTGSFSPAPFSLSRGPSGS